MPSGTSGKQAFKRNITERENYFPPFKEEIGHVEGDTIVGIHHKCAVIILVERQPKVIITLKPDGRKASDMKYTLIKWFETIPRHLFMSITFDYGKISN